MSPICIFISPICMDVSAVYICDSCVDMSVIQKYISNMCTCPQSGHMSLMCNHVFNMYISL